MTDPEGPLRASLPRRERCPACGSFVRKIDRSPLPGSERRRVKDYEERAEARELLKQRAALRKWLALSPTTHRNQIEDQDDPARDIVPRSPD